MTPQKRRVDGSLVADELCPSPPLLKEQLALGPAARASDNPLAPLADFYVRDLDELLRPPNTRWL